MKSVYLSLVLLSLLSSAWAVEYDINDLDYDAYTGQYSLPGSGKPIDEGVLVEHGSHSTHYQTIKNGKRVEEKRLNAQGDIVFHAFYDSFDHVHGRKILRDETQSEITEYFHGVYHGVRHINDKRKRQEQVERYHLGTRHDEGYSFGIPDVIYDDIALEIPLPDGPIISREEIPQQYTGYTLEGLLDITIEHYEEGVLLRRYQFDHTHLEKYQEFHPTRDEKVKLEVRYKDGMLVEITRKNIHARLNGMQVYERHRGTQRLMSYIDGIPHGDWIGVKQVQGKPITRTRAVMDKGLLTGNWLYRDKGLFYRDGEYLDEEPALPQVAPFRTWDIQDVLRPQSFSGFLSYPDKVEHREKGQLITTYSFDRYGKLTKRQDRDRMWNFKENLVYEYATLNAQGQMHGAYRSRHGYGNARLTKGTYHNGEKRGEFKKMSGNNVISVTNYISSTQIKHTDFHSGLFFDRVKSQTQHTKIKDKWVPTGIHKWFRKDGQLSIKFDYTQSPAEHSLYYEQGHLSSHYFTNKAGKKVGLHTQWLRDGKLLSETFYDENGKRIKYTNYKKR